MRPYYRVTADSRDITEQIRSAGLIEMRVRDLLGFESDELTIEVNDIGAGISWPREGAKLSVAMGYRESGLVPQGEYVVSRVSHSGPPDRMTISAKSADLLASLKVPRTRSWHGTTVGGILSSIAREHGLKPAIDPQLASQSVPHLDQAESDLALMTRLGERYHATAKPAGGHLVFVRRGVSLSASGKPLPTVTIQRKEGDSHQFDVEKRPSYTGVRVPYRSGKGGKPAYAMSGSAGNLKTLGTLHPSSAEANAAAVGELKRLTQAVATLQLELGLGNPTLLAGMPIKLQGWRKELLLNWIIEEVEHKISGQSGISSSVKLTTKQA